MSTTPAPFILKLRHLTTLVPHHVGHWNEAGDLFLVVDMDAFSNAVHEVFSKPTSSVKLALQTLVRQLHYYNFSKIETYAPQRGWGFRHKYFLRDDVKKQNLIKRCVKASDRGNEQDESDSDMASAPSITRHQHQHHTTSRVKTNTANVENEQIDPKYVTMLERKVIELEATVNELRGKLAGMELLQIKPSTPAPQQPQMVFSSADLMSQELFPEQPLAMGGNDSDDEVQMNETLPDYEMTPDFDMRFDESDLISDVAPLDLCRQHSLQSPVAGGAATAPAPQMPPFGAMSTLMYMAASAAMQQKQHSAVATQHQLTRSFSLESGSQDVGAF